MSIIDELKKNNVRQAQLATNSAQEHMVELERQRVESEGYKNPHLIKFKKRRAEQALQNKPSLLSVPIQH